MATPVGTRSVEVQTKLSLLGDGPEEMLEKIALDSLRHNSLFALCDAVRQGSEENVRLVLEMGININQENGQKQTPLQLACFSKKYEIAKLLLKEGAEYSEALSLIMRSGRQDLIELLDVNKCDKEGNTPIFYAPESAVKFLIEKGADIHFRNHKGETPIFHIPKGSIEFLVDQGADINARNNEGKTILFHAVDTCSLEFIKKLVAKGADLKVRDNKGNTLFRVYYCKKIGKGGLADFLIENGVDINARNCKGKGLLYQCIEYGCFDEVLSLIKIGVEVSTEKALCKDFSIFDFGYDSLEALINAGLDINIKNTKRGDTFLHQACESMRDFINSENDERKKSQLAILENLIQTLLRAGASVTICDRENQTPIDVLGEPAWFGHFIHKRVYDKLIKARDRQKGSLELQALG